MEERWDELWAGMSVLMSGLKMVEKTASLMVARWVRTRAERWVAPLERCLAMTRDSCLAERMAKTTADYLGSVMVGRTAAMMAEKWAAR